MCVRRKNGINSHAENGFMNGFYVIANDIIFMMSNSSFKLSTKACFSKKFVILEKSLQQQNAIVSEPKRS